MSASMNKSVLRKIAIVAGLIIAGLIGLSVLDLSCAAVITHAAFNSTIAMHLIRPILFVAAFIIINTIGNIVTEKGETEDIQK